jgi:hypothetical protein
VVFAPSTISVTTSSCRASISDLFSIIASSVA